MMPGRWVRREDDTVWQVTHIRTASRTHHAGPGMTPVAVTEYDLTAPDGTRVYSVGQWGTEAAIAIGRPCEPLTLIDAPAAPAVDHERQETR